ncbi:DNA-directed DNA polymerase [Tanacetum coccineum]
MTRSSTKELLMPFKNPEREFRSSRKLFKTLSLDELRSPEYNLFSDLEENSEEEAAKTMAETMEQYMSKTRSDYGLGIARPKIDDKDHFELKGQFLKELRDNTFSGSDHEDANEHIEKVLEIDYLFHVPNITQDQIMLRVFPMSLTGATSHWLRNKLYAQLNNLRREIKKVNEKVYDAQVGCEQCKGPHYTKDFPLKEEGKTLEEAYYTQFGAPFQQGGKYRAAALGFYQRNNTNPSYQERRQSMEESQSKFLRASIKTLEIQIGQMSKVLQERGFGILLSSTETNLRDHVKSISTTVEADMTPIHPIRVDDSLPQKEKDPRSFTLPCYINNVFFENALADLGASVIVMPLSTYLNLGLGELAHTKLTVELADKTVKHPKGVAENVLVGIGKFVFLIDVFKRKITLRVEDEKIILKSMKPASSLIKKVCMLSLRECMELDLEARLMGETLVLNRSLDPLYGDYIKLNDLNVPLELRRDQVEDLMPTIEQGEAAAASDAHVDVSPGADIPPSPPLPTDMSAGVSSGVSTGAPTGPSTVSPGSTTVPTSSSVPAAETIPASSGTTPETPSSPVRDARKGKGVAVEEPTPTHDKTFKQLEEERLGWEAAQRLQAQELADFEKQRAESLMKDANLARQMSQDFEMTEDQRKRQQEVLASAANYSDAAWDIILARLQANPDLSSIIFGVEFTDDDFAARMVALVNTRRKELAAQRAQERRERPMTPSQLRQYMRTYVKNQGPAVYSTGWTMAQVRKLSPEQLQEEFDKIQRAVAFTRGLKRDGSPMSSASSKKLKTGDDEVNVEAPSHGVPQEEETAQVEVPSQKATIEDVDAPSNLASTAQHTASSLKKVGTKKKRLGRKGVHTSPSTIPIEEGDPETEHKVCLKYASDADSASDDDTPVNLYAVVDWELLPTGLGSINVFYRLDNSRKYFTSLREILHLVTRADLMTLYGRVMTFYQDKKAEGVGLVLWGDLKVLLDSPEVNDGSDVWKNQHTWSIQSWKLYSFSGVHVLETVSGLVLHMFVDKKYPLSVSLIERMLDHQLEICRGTVGNELTTAVQLIAFLKKQISDSKRPKVHDCVFCTTRAILRDWVLVNHRTSNGVQLTMLPKTRWFSLARLLQLRVASPRGYGSWYVVPTGRVKFLAGKYVVPTGKDNVIVNAGRTKVIPAGITILVLVVLCLLRVDSIFS